MSANIETRLFPTPLDNRSDLPLRVQLRERLLSAIGAGVLHPGDRLPTMRALAVHLSIDLNTVQRAYAELERLGAVQTFRARGSFVSTSPPVPDPRLQQAEIDALATATIAQARARGLDPREIAHAIQRVIASTDPLPHEEKG